MLMPNLQIFKNTEIPDQVYRLLDKDHKQDILLQSWDGSILNTNQLN